MTASMTEAEMVRAYMLTTGCDRKTAVAHLKRATFPFRQAAPTEVPAETVRDQMTRALRQVFGGAVTLVARFDWLVTDGDKFGVVAGRMINTKRYRRAKKALRELFRSQLPPGREPFADPVAVNALLSFPPDSKRRDVANYSKIVHDALTGVAYHDDSQIHDSRWRRGPDSETPLLEITIIPLQGP